MPVLAQKQSKQGYWLDCHTLKRVHKERHFPLGQTEFESQKHCILNLLFTGSVTWVIGVEAEKTGKDPSDIDAVLPFQGGGVDCTFPYCSPKPANGHRYLPCKTDTHVF